MYYYVLLLLLYYYKKHVFQKVGFRQIGSRQLIDEYSLWTEGEGLL